MRKIQSLNQEQALQISQILEHLSNTDGDAVVTWDGEITLSTKDGVILGVAWWCADAELWQFRAYETGMDA